MQKKTKKARKRPTISEERSLAFQAGRRLGREEALTEIREAVGKALGFHNVLERLKDLEDIVECHLLNDS